MGGGFANIKYDDGQSHAPTFIIGYRRYVWKKAHVEYQLWPSYNRSTPPARRHVTTRGQR